MPATQVRCDSFCTPAKQREYKEKTCLTCSCFERAICKTAYLVRTTLISVLTLRDYAVRVLLDILFVDTVRKVVSI